MFLISLRITKNSNVIREITFKRGLNLAVDMTTKQRTDSGNDVGKTTFLRVIDYCLGSAGENIFTDPEFRTKNEKILSFLQNGVRFELLLGTDSYTLKIERQLGEKPKLNGEELSEPDFNLALGRELFRLRSTKPSMRQLMGKFVRTEHYQIANTIKFLHPKTAPEEYDPIFLYLFGFENQELLATKKKLITKAKKLANQTKAIKEISRETLKQMLIVINRDIAELEQKYEQFEVSGSVKDEISELEKKRAQISDASLELSNLRMRLRMSEQTIQNLEQAVAKIDTKVIDQLYRQANKALPNLNKKFDDLLQFHNKMISNKIAFVRKTNQELQTQIASKAEALDRHLQDEKGLLLAVSKKGALADLQKVQKDLSDLYEQRGQKEALFTKLDDLTKQSEEVQRELKQLDDILLAYQGDLDKKLGNFNLVFSDYSKRLYNEEYVISYEIKEGKHALRFDFKIDNVRGNEGSGKKRAQITAFDLAYLKFLALNKANTARFTLHDRVEEVDANQIRTLFEIANEIDGQYIVAVLSDKLRTLDSSWIRENTILTLSQTDKFFKLP